MRSVILYHAAAGVLLVACGVAAADPPQLRLRGEPTPRSLRMRRPVAQAPVSQPSRAPTPMPAAPTASATALEAEDLEGLRDLQRRVSATITMGYQVDGARTSGERTLHRDVAREGVDYAGLRSYGFGEGFLSTRGVGATSLETYFALRFQAAKTLTFRPDPEAAPDNKVTVTSPIATWFERSGLELRSGWAEVKDFLPKQWGLSKLRVRAGSQYVYGPWILHLDGLHIAYEGPTLTAAYYAGPRHSDYQRGPQRDDRPIATGASLRFDLRGLTNAVPIAVAGEFLTLTRSDVTGQEAVDAELVQADWRPRRDIAVIAQLRGVDRELANQRIEVRTRYKQVTNFVFELMRRFNSDWRWDPSLARPSSTTLGEALEGEQSLDARRYLDLGPVLPQLLFSVRAGTLIRENIDLLGRAAIASDLKSEGEQSHSFAAPYVELGGAVEIKVRRQVAVGFSILSRQTDRDLVAAQDRLVDHVEQSRAPQEPDTVVPDPALNTLGEAGFTELGGTLKMSLGARKFSALVEVYGRRTRYSVIYVDPDAAIPEDDVRGGGRVTVDAWVGRRIRLFVSYDVSSVLATAPELSGYKSLRLTLTGTY